MGAGPPANLDPMAPRTDVLDLGGLPMSPGEGRRLDLHVAIEPLEYGGQRYTVEPALVPARLDLSRTITPGWALRLRFDAVVRGPCVRCLAEAAPAQAVDARDVSQPGAGEELESPYVVGEQLDLAAWARDALALALPPLLLCRPDCRGLCPVCGVDLNDEGEHAHEPEPDPRWAALRELKLE